VSLPAHAAALSLQRLGNAVHDDGHGCTQVLLRKVDGAEICGACSSMA